MQNLQTIFPIYWKIIENQICIMFNMFSIESEILMYYLQEILHNQNIGY